MTAQQQRVRDRWAKANARWLDAYWSSDNNKPKGWAFGWIRALCVAFPKPGQLDLTLREGVHR